VPPPSNNLKRRAEALQLVTSSRPKNNAAMRRVARFFVFLFLFLLMRDKAFATTKGLSEIITPDLEPEGDLSLSFQRQDSLIGNPYQLQAELGLTSWAEAAVFKGFQPNELIFGAEFGLLTKEPWLLSTGFANW
jgi:hypothetical protein